jgi:TPR repeat protein
MSLELACGIAKNPVEGARYSNISADGGDIIGQVQYAQSLELGIGVAKDVHEAAKYYRLVADRGGGG